MPKGGRRVRAGRPRKPTELKVIEGTFRNDRDGKRPPVANVPQWPSPPKHLNDREARLWRLLKKRIGAWVAPSDWVILNGMVSLIDHALRIQEAERMSEAAGAPLTFKYVVTENGTDAQDQNIEAEAKENPLFTLGLKHWKEIRAYAALLGMSPVDRARMPTVDEKAVDPFDAFLKKGAAK
jgi:phage terminase small subunit